MKQKRKKKTKGRNGMGGGGGGTISSDVGVSFGKAKRLMLNNGDTERNTRLLKPSQSGYKSLFCL